MDRRFMFTSRRESSLVLPRRMPNFVQASSLNNHYFSVGNDEYEYIDGCFYKKVDTISVGDSFGQNALQMQCNQQFTVKTECLCEFAYLDKVGYEKGLLNVREELDRKMVEFLRTQPAFTKLTYGKVLSLF